MRRIIARLPGDVLVESVVVPDDGHLHHRYAVTGGPDGERDFDSLTALSEYVMRLTGARPA